MFQFTIGPAILMIVQLLYSYWLKNYSSFQNKWIPLLNLGVALGVFTVIEVVQKPEGGAWAAILLVLTKALETAIASTGVHSALKNTFSSPEPTK